MVPPDCRYLPISRTWWRAGWYRQTPPPLSTAFSSQPDRACPRGAPEGAGSVGKCLFGRSRSDLAGDFLIQFRQEIGDARGIVTKVVAAVTRGRPHVDDHAIAIVRHADRHIGRKAEHETLGDSG